VRIFGIIVLAAMFSITQNTRADPLPLDKQVESFFAPDVDLLQIKLDVDKLSGDTADSIDTTKSFNDLVAALASNQDSQGDLKQRFLALKKVIYESGGWNGDNAFSYDLRDPTGQIPQNRFLSHYLNARKGNCVTMPFLVMLLGQKIGLKMTLALAPHHEFVKLSSDYLQQWNVETTSGLSFARDQHYREQLPMSNVAVEKGSYLRGLTQEEVIAITAEQIVHQAIEHKRYWDAIKVADVLLKRFPTSVTLLLERGSAYGHLVEEEFLIPFGQNIPPEMRPVAEMYFQNQQRDFAAAEALGWRENEGQLGVSVQ
jgi:regulator of sirC expression with transglutaminase-like and TPR domain